MTDAENLEEFNESAGDPEAEKGFDEDETGTDEGSDGAGAEDAPPHPATQAGEAPGQGVIVSIRMLRLV